MTWHDEQARDTEEFTTPRSDDFGIVRKRLKVTGGGPALAAFARIEARVEGKEALATMWENTARHNADLADKAQARVEELQRERDSWRETAKNEAEQFESRVGELETALHVAEETLGLETDEDSWISLKRRAEAAERALREIAKGAKSVHHASQIARAALASSEGEKKRILVNTRTGERREWEPGLVLQAEGPLEWELREE